MVELSRGLSRFEILCHYASEAVEEAYRKSIAENRFCAVETGAMVSRLANFQPVRFCRSLAAWRIWRLKSCAGMLRDFDDLLEG